MAVTWSGCKPNSRRWVARRRHTTVPLTSAGRMVPWSTPRPPGHAQAARLGWAAAGPGGTRLADRTGDRNACSQQQFVVPGRPPHQSCQRALLHQGEPSLAGQTQFSCLPAATSHKPLPSAPPAPTPSSPTGPEPTPGPQTKRRSRRGPPRRHTPGEHASGAGHAVGASVAAHSAWDACVSPTL
jgi:hypothetical protein